MKARPIPSSRTFVELDLGTIEPSIAGPRRPQDRVPLAEAPKAFLAELPRLDMKANETSVERKRQCAVPATNSGTVTW